jgi:hypothetical protein
MNFIDATASYEAWLRKEVRILPDDLAKKHEAMKESPFPFLRATYYRWVQTWTELAQPLAKTLPVLAVGDLHVENFGTWRDAEARLVWGVNDFDETAVLPLAIDLTRLAVSAMLASDHHSLGLKRPNVAESLLEGYRDGIAKGGHAFVLEEQNPEMRDMMRARLKDARPFWGKLSNLTEFKGKKPKTAVRILMRMLPDGVESLRIVHRVAGLGSLGRQRLTAIGQLDGGSIAREVKQLAPPASFWAFPKSDRTIRYNELVRESVRSPDPYLKQQGNWIARRLSPSNSRVEIYELPKEHDAELLLRCMGVETANLHLGSANRKKLSKAAASIKASEFAKVNKALEESLLRDWKEWKAK